jgi:transcriptional regulator with XRE-family HTH domain
MAGRPTSAVSRKIGQRIQNIMRQKNCTQEQVALRLGLGSQAVLSNYVNGRREIPVDVINRFCAEFNVPIATLFEDDDIILNTEDSLALDIMLAIDEFLAEKHLALTGEQRKMLVKDFLKQDCHDALVIRSTLSALQAVNSDMFTKRK